MPAEPTDADTGLPFVDEHQVLVPAPPEVVWRALTSWFTRSRPAGAEALADLLAAGSRRARGDSLAEGATLPGFTVAEAAPGRRLRLVGHHRFSSGYALIFALSAQPGGTVLSARTYAEFPGVRGRAYRALVIGSGAHRFLVKRMLRAIRRGIQRA